MVSPKEHNFVKFGWKGIQIALKEDYDLLFATSPLTAGIPGIVMKLFRKKNLFLKFVTCGLKLPKALGMKNPFYCGDEYFGVVELSLRGCLCWSFSWNL